MKCKICGAQSGKYPLCRACNIKKEKGEIIKCTQCNNWHYANLPCPIAVNTSGSKYLYEVKKSLISTTEQKFHDAIKASVPDGYCVFPQINMATFIERTDNTRFHNELFRNVDFLITDALFSPKIVIEINDQTHLTNDRKERDEKVQKICAEAGIPILKLWTSYGTNPEYIKARIAETLISLPVARIHHFSQTPPQNKPNSNLIPPAIKKSGCYIATCVYGSYDCPQVWTLRRYRDYTLLKSWYGRAFVRFYYTVSPYLVKWFGKSKWFRHILKPSLDKIVSVLQIKGFVDTPYEDIKR